MRKLFRRTRLRARVPDERRIRGMFDRVAPRYDLLNSLLSLGLDASWRRAAARAAGLHPRDSALDICCGSGKLTNELTEAAPRGRVVGLDTRALLGPRPAEAGRAASV